MKGRVIPFVISSKPSNKMLGLTKGPPKQPQVLVSSLSLNRGLCGRIPMAIFLDRKGSIEPERGLLTNHYDQTANLVRVFLMAPVLTIHGDQYSWTPNDQRLFPSGRYDNMILLVVLQPMVPWSHGPFDQPSILDSSVESSCSQGSNSSASSAPAMAAAAISAFTWVFSC